MAKEEEAEGGEDEVHAAPSKAPLIMAVCAAAMVGAVGGMYVMMQKAGSAHPAAASGGGGKEGGEHEGGGHEEAAEAPPAAGGEGPVITLAPFVVNVNDPGDDPHYLKCTIALELGNPKLEAEFEKLTPRVRNALLMYLSSLKAEDTYGSENKKKMMEKLRGSLEPVLGKGAVREVYLTEFVIQ